MIGACKGENCREIEDRTIAAVSEKERDICTSKSTRGSETVHQNKVMVWWKENGGRKWGLRAGGGSERNFGGR